MGPSQLTEVLRRLPSSINPNLLVGFDTKDDAGVLKLSDDMALVQTVDFFTPIVDDPYAYGSIAAANALSDVYAMGGRPVSVLNIACFSPDAAPPDVWAEVLRGSFEKTTEAGAVVMGGHSVEDREPKFGLAVTGFVNPGRMFVNTEAKVGDVIYLTKPLGTGIVTTAAKNDVASREELLAATKWMQMLNRKACEAGHKAGVHCATDITGFGLVGHLLNVARASSIRIRLEARELPILPGVQRLVKLGQLTGGAAGNAEFVGGEADIAHDVPDWLRHVCHDPQTSGGLALFSQTEVSVGKRIGEVVEGDVGLEVVL